MCCILCSWFVEIKTWQVLKCTYLVMINPVKNWAHNLFRYTHSMVILGGHASTEPINSSFSGNSYLITKLYSLKYKVSLVVHGSRAWISHYILTLTRILSMASRQRVENWVFLHWTTFVDSWNGSASLILLLFHNK